MAKQVVFTDNDGYSIKAFKDEGFIRLEAKYEDDNIQIDLDKDEARELAFILLELANNR